MSTRPRPWPRRSLALLVAAAIGIGACVPQPAGRATPTQPPVTASASASAIPSPSGPTPPPSFVRPTATPLPTFLAYVVVSGDTLSSIARRFRTTPFSIAYWNRHAHPSLDPESEGYAPDRIAIGWTLLVMPGVVLDGSDLPEETPTATPTAVIAPTEAPDPTPSTGGVSVVVRHGPRASNQVALTFDMGGRLDPALEILGWLVAEDVPATIFPTGKTGTTTTDGRAALDMVADHLDLFDVGNHSWSHPDFRDLDAEAMRDQLERTEAGLLATINVSTKPWFRPPYGGLDDQIPAVVGGAGWAYTVMWEVDTIDWKPMSDGGPSAADIAAKVVANAKGGSIVLMHLGGFETLDALPDMLDGLRAKGLEPVTLGELFGES